MDNVTITDFMKISSEISTRDVTIGQLNKENKDLRKELDSVKAENMALQTRIEELMVENERAHTENMVFRTLYTLSKEKVRIFFKSLNNFHIISICYTFMVKTLSDIAFHDVIKEIDEITGIKDSPMILNRFEKDSKCVVGNRDIVDCDFNQ